jgi:hypothetical protein
MTFDELLLHLKTAFLLSENKTKYIQPTAWGGFLLQKLAGPHVQETLQTQKFHYRVQKSLLTTGSLT